MSELAQVHWIPVTVDTFIDKNLPNHSFAQSDHLRVGLSQEGNLYRTLLRFEIPSDIVHNQIWLASLVLTICQNDYPHYAKEYGVFSIAGDWEQGKVTWNNQPHAKEGIVSSTFITDQLNCTVEWEISPLIKKLGQKSTWNLELRGLNEYENSLVAFFSQGSIHPDKQPVLRLVAEKAPPSFLAGTFQADYAASQTYYNSFLHCPLPAESLEILRLLENKSYSAIVVHTETANIEPSLRAKQLLKALTQRGYLAFFCHSTKGDFKIEELANNLFMLNKPEYLLPVLRNQSLVVLCTNILQLSWADLLPHKFLWYDVGEPLELSSLADKNRLSKHNVVLKEADLVTYSANQLKEYLLARPDAVYLPNEANNQGPSAVDAFAAAVKTVPKAWSIFGNIDVRGKINIMTETFLNFEGKEFYSGGAERYLLDLAAVCSDLGLVMSIYQYGNFPWVRRFRNIDVISLARGSLTTRSTDASRQFNRQFYEQVQERSLLNIYSAFYQAHPLGATPNIGISHGVSWDNPFYKIQLINQFFKHNSRYLLGAKICEHLISVDTNTANWFQTIDYELGQKIKVISNYVDLETFSPSVNFDQARDKIIILYPRRLYEARGLYLVLEIVDAILDQFPHVEFHFVGKGFEKDTQHVVQKQKKWPGRIKWYSLPPEEMPTAYKNADISLIPTLYSEGTSLSCLEAMACGNAVIATRIGGLTDLVIDRFNGLRIEPNATALEQALRYLLHHQETLLALKRRARMVAEAFPKTHWMAEWTKLIQQKINASGCVKKVAANPPLIKIFLKNMPEQNSKIGDLITTLLKQGYLIYVLVKDLPAQPNLSFGRIQWVDWQEEALAKPDFVIAEQAIAEDISQKAQLIITELWLSDFCSSPANSLKELALPS